MSDFGKKLIAFGVVALLMFGVIAAITWFKVNQYDEGEFVMNTMQAIATALGAVFLAQLRSVFGVVVLIVSVFCASSAEAGIFGMFSRARSVSSACASGKCGLPSAVKPMPLPAKPLPSATKPIKPVAPKSMAPKPGPVLVK